MWIPLLITLFGLSHAGLRQLRDYSLAGPVKIEYVEDGSNLYLCSSDDPATLNAITISSNGLIVSLDQLLTNFDANGFLLGFPVNSDLTISTQNSADVTNDLNGVLYISSRDMARDPNFLVYSVIDKTLIVNRPTNSNTTLVILNPLVSRLPSDPEYKALFNTRIENIVQPKTTKLWFYKDIPENGYDDPNYQVTADKLIFTNPVNYWPAERPNTYFFDNIEPLQYSLRAWHIRAIGGIQLTISQQWKDPSESITTSPTTTGFVMSQFHTVDTVVNYVFHEYHVCVFGLLVSTQLFADVNATMCSNIECEKLRMHPTPPMISKIFEWNLNTTSLYIKPSQLDSGVFYMQYFRVDINDDTNRTQGSTSTMTSTTTKVEAKPSTTVSIETTTKSTSPISLIIPSLFTVLLTY